MNLSAIESTEFVAEASRRAAHDPHSVHEAPVSAYFDWALTPERFSHLVVPAETWSWMKRLLGRSKKSPQLMSDLHATLAHRRALLQLARSGFGLLIGTKSDLGGEEEFLSRLGYSRAGASILGMGGAHDPIRAAWNRQPLAAAVELALTSPQQTVCIFGHDGDPAYLLRLKRDPRESVPSAAVNAG